VRAIEAITPGLGKDAVESRLGPPPSATADEWRYELDDHSGYLVRFDAAARVEIISSYKN
jgi:hypothetical protein